MHARGDKLSKHLKQHKAKKLDINKKNIEQRAKNLKLKNVKLKNK